MAEERRNGTTDERQNGPAQAPDAALVTVIVPGLLARFTDERHTLRIRATTLAECIDRLVESYPAIEPHLFEGAGRLRAHLELFHDGSGVEWEDASTAVLEDGDEVLILQAVSGG